MIKHAHLDLSAYGLSIWHVQDYCTKCQHCWDSATGNHWYFDHLYDKCDIAFYTTIQ